MLPRAHPHPFPATRRLTVLVVALLAVHLVLAWLALQATWAFVELAWRAVARPESYRALLVAHLDQFRVLRTVQLALWLVTGALFVSWVGRARANLPALGAAGSRYAPRQPMTVCFMHPFCVLRELWNASDPRYSPGMPWSTASTPVRLRWWWTLLCGAASAEALARGLAYQAGLPLDLGGAMQVLVLGQLLTGAAAGVGITVVVGIDSRQATAAVGLGIHRDPGV